MDLSMPVMDGMTSTRAIRQHEDTNNIERCRIFALTGLASASARLEALSSGVDHFLTKPLNFKMLGALLKKEERKKNLANEARAAEGKPAEGETARAQQQQGLEESSRTTGKIEPQPQSDKARLQHDVRVVDPQQNAGNAGNAESQPELDMPKPEQRIEEPPSHQTSPEESNLQPEGQQKEETSEIDEGKPRQGDVEGEKEQETEQSDDR